MLIVDAAQGVEAQTVANVHLAHKQGLTIIPVINKIDLPNADIPAVHKQLEEILAIPAEEAIDASAKMGIGIEEILEAVVHRIPSPPKPPDEVLRGLVFDCVFDIYRGVVAYVRIFSGEMEADQGIKLINNDARYEVKEVGVFTPKMFPQKRLQAGDVGYFIANIKSTADIKIGDTRDRFASSREGTVARLPGDSSDGLQRDLPDQHRRLRAFENGDREIAAERFGVRLSAGKFRRARVRIPLRVPRPAAHGDHPGAAPARVRHGYHRDVAERHLRNPHHARRNDAGR